MCDCECAICVEEYDDTNLRRLHCPHCRFACCRACMQVHCLRTATCPSCTQALPLPWLVQHLDPSYMRHEYKRARRKQLVAQQLPLLRAPKRCTACWQRQHAGACLPEDMTTAGLLSSTCRRCPGCDAVIQKVDDGACDVMHCTRCRTSFRFAGGEVVSNALHNPEQDKVLARDAGTVPRRDVPCAHLLDVSGQNVVLLSPEDDGRFTALVDNLQLMAMHEYAVSTNVYSVMRRQHEEGTLSEERWGARMFRREWANARNIEMAMACSCAVEMLMTTLANHVYMSEHLERGVMQCLQERDMPGIMPGIMLAILVHTSLLPIAMRHIRRIAGYFNNRCAEVAKLYDSTSVLHIDRAWRVQQCFSILLDLPVPRRRQ